MEYIVQPDESKDHAHPSAIPGYTTTMAETAFSPTESVFHPPFSLRWRTNGSGLAAFTSPLAKNDTEIDHLAAISSILMNFVI